MALFRAAFSLEWIWQAELSGSLNGSLSAVFFRIAASDRFQSIPAVPRRAITTSRNSFSPPDPNFAFPAPVYFLPLRR
jgi:hypothetical protein